MAETRKLAAILAADIAGYSRLTAADEDRTLARLRALRGDVIDPAIAAIMAALSNVLATGS
jgi:adenylate cyclase